MIELTTIDEVIEVLGGRVRAAYMVGVGPSAVSNWKKAGRIARSAYSIHIEALHAQGMTAPKSLWGMKEGVGREATVNPRDRGPNPTEPRCPGAA